MENLENNFTFEYQLLSRLKQDCDYYLGNGNRVKKHLWAGDESAQIIKMKELYEELPTKPEWLTSEEIDRYEAAMVGSAVVMMPFQGECSSPSDNMDLPDIQIRKKKPC